MVISINLDRERAVRGFFQSGFQDTCARQPRASASSFNPEMGVDSLAEKTERGPTGGQFSCSKEQRPSFPFSFIVSVKITAANITDRFRKPTDVNL
jgi:hypothetical protein